MNPASRSSTGPEDTHGKNDASAAVSASRRHRYRFPTKAALVHGVIEHVIQRWADRLAVAVGKPYTEATSYERITAHVNTVVGSKLDLSDLAVFFDTHYRSELTAAWADRMEPWPTP